MGLFVVWSGVAGGPGREPRAFGYEDALLRPALDQAADQHAALAAVVRGRAWNAATVRRLARWLAGEPAAASADDVALLREELRRPVALSVSGAVSLGNYQAGFLYYYGRQLADARRLAARLGAARGEAWIPPGETSPLGLVTGASSGSINAFITAIASCQAQARDPRGSLFWNVWIPVGGEDLAASRDAQPTGLLSVGPIEKAIGRLEVAWKTGPWLKDQPCTVDVGLSATRLRERTVAPLDGVNLFLQRQTEKLMFRMRGQGGAPPQLEPFVPAPAPAGATAAADADSLFRKLFPQVGPPGRPLALGDVTDVLTASSAFSFAFPPHLLALTMRPPGLPPVADTALFTDGGVFDDRPAGLAVRMKRWALGRAGEAASGTRYIIQDPDVTLWRPSRADAGPPDSGSAAPPPIDRRFVSTWLPFVGDFLDSAFQVELMDAIEGEPTLYAGLEVPPRRVPVAGAYLMEFLAFAERDFRIFDFFTGMVDAWQQLADSSLAFQVMAAAGQSPGFDDKAPELDCLLAWRAHQLMNAGPPPAAACAGVGAPAGARPADPILRPNIEALINASAVTLVWSQRINPTPGDDSDETVFLRALGERRGPDRPPYRYRELPYRGGLADADTLTPAIRDVLQDIIERTTLQQHDGASRFVVGGVGKALANFYAYRPPSVLLGAGMLSDAGFELQGAARLPWDRHRPAPIDLAVDAVFRVTDIGETTVDAPDGGSQRLLAFTYMGALHLVNELQLQRWAPDLQSVVQFHLGGGWAIESLQTWNGPLLWRHGPELVVGATLLQRLYLDVSTTFFLDDCAGNNRCARAAPNLADRMLPVVDSSWSLRVALGYRFFID